MKSSTDWSSDDDNKYFNVWCADQMNIFSQMTIHVLTMCIHSIYGWDSENWFYDNIYDYLFIIEVKILAAIKIFVYINSQKINEIMQLSFW